jgi:hypothetical protein
MQILLNSPDQLILQQRHIWAALIVGAFAILMALMAWFARRNAPAISLGLLVIALMLGAVALGTFSYETVEFTRAEGQMVIRSLHPLRRTPKTVPLHEIHEAVAESRGGTQSEIGYKGHRATRPALARRGNAPSVLLAPIYADPEETIVLVKTINDWLRWRPSTR